MLIIFNSCLDHPVTKRIEQEKGDKRRRYYFDVSEAHIGIEYWCKAHAHLASIHEQVQDLSLAKTVLKQGMEGYARLLLSQ